MFGTLQALVGFEGTSLAINAAVHFTKHLWTILMVRGTKLVLYDYNHWFLGNVYKFLRVLLPEALNIHVHVQVLNHVQVCMAIRVCVSNLLVAGCLLMGFSLLYCLCFLADYFSPFALPSAGWIPFAQTVMCIQTFGEGWIYTEYFKPFHNTA